MDKTDCEMFAETLFFLKSGPAGCVPCPWEDCGISGIAGAEGH
jgi:hypothetical protein